MNKPAELHALGQRIWLDTITRDMIEEGTLKHYIDDFSLTGLTSNPTIFDEAIAKSSLYDESIQRLTRGGRRGEAVFEELALQDLRRAADLLRPTFDASAGIDGWVSMELSPLLAYDTQKSIEAAARIHREADRPNLFVKIPGTREGVPAIEESIFAGVPINVTLLFSVAQVEAAANAYLRAIERRLRAGLDPRVASVASLFVSRWDRAVAERVPAELRNRLGIAIGRRTYRAVRELQASPRWQALASAGARPQRLLFASTGTKDPHAPDTLYVEALVARDTIDTMPEKTLQAFADHGQIGGEIPSDGGDADAVLARFVQAGVDLDRLAEELQREGAEAFVKSWNALLRRVEQKSAA
jgi:transaldolase